MTPTQVDVLVIGAGPSGSVAAAYLHNQNIKVKVVEKNIFPRFVIGESLLPRCMEHFEETGLLDCLKQQDFEIKRGARFLRNGNAYSFDFAEKSTEGWNWTWQVPRADFDKTLTDELEKKGVDIEFNTEVIEVTFNEDGSSCTTVKTPEGTTETILAKFIIDSSGFGRVLPRLLDLDAPAQIPKHASIFTHVVDSKRPAGEEGTLITFDVVKDESWLWVIPFSNGITSLGYVGPTEDLEAFKGTPSERLQQMLALSSHYHDRFIDCEFIFEPIIIKNISKAVTQLYGKGFALTGNSAEFLDPVFSSGVTFATESGLLAAKLATRQLRGERINWQIEYADYIKNGVDVFATYVREWYTGNFQKIFFREQDNVQIKKQITSVLAGYVWDTSNPFVKKHHRIIKTLAKVVDIESDPHTS
ncbi:NAD(P)/FAD-dependent oxidoreductase [Jejudonia soesokkakensis]|uniref:NAD(P)/FAD-dependent oxidoreductase n=1 Tax=Jejudonia soesokkakensis TaxID=1323432 RepID=A0ABW2MWL8_9FLAO